MITGAVSAQFIGNGRVQINVSEAANNSKGGSAQIIGRDIALFNSDNAAISYANLVNQTGVLFGPRDNRELVKDVFQLSSKE